jgi:lipopolysaccharide export system protein LptA
VQGPRAAAESCLRANSSPHNDWEIQKKIGTQRHKECLNLKWLFDTNKLSLAACSLAILQPHAPVLAAPPPAPRQQPESSIVQSGSNNPGPGPAAKTISPKPKPGAPKPTETFAIIEADQQSYDSPLGRYVAKGHVKVRFNGWILLADRVEVAERSRSFYATGKVRLKKGDQYLQASSVRYSNWEGTGEIEDVYGVIDQDTLKRDTALQTTTTPSATQANAPTEAELPPSFACPQLTASTNRSAISILPPGKTTLPTMAAPHSCLGAAGTNATAKPKRLMEALESVVFQPSQYKANPSFAAPNVLGSKPTANQSLSPIGIDQRVKNVSYQQSWSTGVSINLLGLIGYTAPANTAGQGQLAAPKIQKTGGMISKIRFQTTAIKIQRNTWSARQLAFTNDPFTPANSWTIARNVTAVQSPDGTTKIWSRSGNIILENKYSLPAIFSQTLGKEKSAFAFGFDNLDRDGFYLGYNLKPIKIGQGGSLSLQPQLLVERAISGESSSFIAPGASLDSGNVTQSITAADAFGLLAKLQLPINRFNLSSDLSLATLNPENLSSGTRNTTRLTTPIPLPGHSSATAGLFGTYRERTYNGSLGLQNVIYAYGTDIGGSLTIQTNSPQKQAEKTKIKFDSGMPNTSHNPNNSSGLTNPSQSKSFFNPINLNWQLRSGNYQANLFSTGTLGNLWRSTLLISAGSSFSIWEGKPITNAADPTTGLRYSPSYVIPGLRLDFGASGNLANYGDGSNQNSLTLFGGPSITLGHFDKPFFDYTRIAASIAGTFNNGLSPFSFDRAVDLRTASFSVAQQIYGPLVLEAGATYNIDPGSIYNGEASYSYLEVKLQRRSYELGIYFSPYDGIGGVRIKLNDFNFDGSGAPFMPTSATSTMPIRRSPI